MEGEKEEGLVRREGETGGEGRLLGILERLGVEFAVIGREWIGEGEGRVLEGRRYVGCGRWERLCRIGATSKRERTGELRG